MVNVNYQLYPWLEKKFSHTEQLFKTGKLPKVLLFTGPQGLGKLEFALCIQDLIRQKDLLDEKAISADQNDKPLIVSNTNTHILGYATNSIKIDDIRNIIETSGQSDIYQATKTYIINNIENLTEAAANALLKVLETDGNNYFLFTSSNPGQVLATILSRCHKVSLSPSSEDEIKLQQSWLKKQIGIEPGFILECANYGPLVATEYYNNGYIDKYTFIQQTLDDISQVNIVIKFKLIQDYLKVTVDKKTKFDTLVFIDIVYHLYSGVNYKISDQLISYRQYLVNNIAIDSDNILFSILKLLVDTRKMEV